MAANGGGDHNEIINNQQNVGDTIGGDFGGSPFSWLTNGRDGSETDDKFEERTYIGDVISADTGGHGPGTIVRLLIEQTCYEGSVIAEKVSENGSGAQPYDYRQHCVDYLQQYVDQWRRFLAREYLHQPDHRVAQRLKERFAVVHLRELLDDDLFRRRLSAQKASSPGVILPRGIWKPRGIRNAPIPPSPQTPPLPINTVTTLLQRMQQQPQPQLDKQSQQPQPQLDKQSQQQQPQLDQQSQQHQPQLDQQSQQHQPQLDKQSQQQQPQLDQQSQQHQPQLDQQSQQHQPQLDQQSQQHQPQLDQQTQQHQPQLDQQSQQQQSQLKKHQAQQSQLEPQVQAQPHLEQQQASQPLPRPPPPTYPSQTSLPSTYLPQPPPPPLPPPPITATSITETTTTNYQPPTHSSYPLSSFSTSTIETQESVLPSLPASPPPNQESPEQQAAAQATSNQSMIIESCEDQSSVSSTTETMAQIQLLTINNQLIDAWADDSLRRIFALENWHDLRRFNGPLTFLIGDNSSLTNDGNNSTITVRIESRRVDAVLRELETIFNVSEPFERLIVQNVQMNDSYMARFRDGLCFRCFMFTKTVNGIRGRAWLRLTLRD